ncbi:acyl-CoA synthetase family protein [Candidatus Methylacidithermus pantelleriae]|nr:acyl-protein synthetase [Candidatus Methylacidithermus pantelleriae]
MNVRNASLTALDFTRAAQRQRWIQLLSQLSWEEKDWDRLALALFQYHAHHCPPYRRLVSLLGTQPVSWRDIPALPQAIFKETPVFCGDPSAAKVMFETSGTTRGSPGIHRMRSIDLYRWSAQEGAKRAGLPYATAELHFLTPSPRKAPHSSLVRMFSFWGSRRYFWIDHGTLQVGAFRKALDQACARTRPVGICGPALAFVFLLENWPRGWNPNLSPGSFLLQTGGLKGRRTTLSKEILYGELARAFGLPDDNIWDEYGMTELSSQAYARGLRESHRTPPWARVLVIDPASGKEVPVGHRGWVRWFDLANVDSVLAVDTEDEAIRTQEGFRLLGRHPEARIMRGCSLLVDELRSSL